MYFDLHRNLNSDLVRHTIGPVLIALGWSLSLIAITKAVWHTILDPNAKNHVRFFYLTGLAYLGLAVATIGLILAQGGFNG
jgi:hypothetical protein